MSGIYLTLWDDHPEFDRVLKSTPGGVPHLTLAWTGKNLSRHDLIAVARKTMGHLMLKDITLVKAEVNTFFHKKTQRVRHDVLVKIAENDLIEFSRTQFIKQSYPEIWKEFNMMEPHTTVKICWTREEAEKECECINTLLPIKVQITGVTIN